MELLHSSHFCRGGLQPLPARPRTLGLKPYLLLSTRGSRAVGVRGPLTLPCQSSERLSAHFSRPAGGICASQRGDASNSTPACPASSKPKEPQPTPAHHPGPVTVIGLAVAAIAGYVLLAPTRLLPPWLLLDPPARAGLVTAPTAQDASHRLHKSSTKVTDSNTALSPRSAAAGGSVAETQQSEASSRRSMMQFIRAVARFSWALVDVPIRVVEWILMGPHPLEPYRAATPVAVAPSSNPSVFETDAYMDHSIKAATSKQPATGAAAAPSKLQQLVEATLRAAHLPNGQTVSEGASTTQRAVSTWVHTSRAWVSTHLPPLPDLPASLKPDGPAAEAATEWLTATLPGRMVLLDMTAMAMVVLMASLLAKAVAGKLSPNSPAKPGTTLQYYPPISGMGTAGSLGSLLYTSTNPFLVCDLPPAKCDLPPPKCDVPSKCDVPPPKCDVPPPKCDLPPPKCDLPPPKCDLPPPKCDLPPADWHAPTQHGQLAQPSGSYTLEDAWLDMLGAATGTGTEQGRTAAAQKAAPKEIQAATGATASRPKEHMAKDKQSAAAVQEEQDDDDIALMAALSLVGPQKVWRAILESAQRSVDAAEKADAENVTQPGQPAHAEGHTAASEDSSIRHWKQVAGDLISAEEVEAARRKMQQVARNHALLQHYLNKPEREQDSSKQDGELISPEEVEASKRQMQQDSGIGVAPSLVVNTAAPKSEAPKLLLAAPAKALPGQGTAAEEKVVEARSTVAPAPPAAPQAAAAAAASEPSTATAPEAAAPAPEPSTTTAIVKASSNADARVLVQIRPSERVKLSLGPGPANDPDRVTVTLCPAEGATVTILQARPQLPGPTIEVIPCTNTASTETVPASQSKAAAADTAIPAAAADVSAAIAASAAAASSAASSAAAAAATASTIAVAASIGASMVLRAPTQGTSSQVGSFVQKLAKRGLHIERIVFRPRRPAVTAPPAVEPPSSHTAEANAGTPHAQPASPAAAQRAADTAGSTMHDRATVKLSTEQPQPEAPTKPAAATTAAPAPVAATEEPKVAPASESAKPGPTAAEDLSDLFMAAAAETQRRKPRKKAPLTPAINSGTTTFTEGPGIPVPGMPVPPTDSKPAASGPTVGPDSVWVMDGSVSKQADGSRYGANTTFSSSYKGVEWRGFMARPWVALARTDFKHHFVGSFDTEKEAAFERDWALVRLLLEGGAKPDGIDVRRLNFPEAFQQYLEKLGHKQTVSKYSGVTWSAAEGRWQVQVSWSPLLKGASKWVPELGDAPRSIHCGFFESELEAARAYDKAVLKYLPEENRYKKLNFPEAAKIAAEAAPTPTETAKTAVDAAPTPTESAKPAVDTTAAPIEASTQAAPTPADVKTQMGSASVATQPQPDVLPAEQASSTQDAIIKDKASSSAAATTEGAAVPAAEAPKQVRSSPYSGVQYSHRLNLWRAVAYVDASTHFLGYFDTPEAAADARDRHLVQACKVTDPRRLNFPNKLPQYMATTPRRFGYNGVTYVVGVNKWKTELRVSKFKTISGLYATELEAASAYDQAVMKNLPKEQWADLLNFPLAGYVKLQEYEQEKAAKEQASKPEQPDNKPQPDAAASQPAPAPATFSPVTTTATAAIESTAAESVPSSKEDKKVKPEAESEKVPVKEVAQPDVSSSSNGADGAVVKATSELSSSVDAVAKSTIEPTSNTVGTQADSSAPKDAKTSDRAAAQAAAAKAWVNRNASFQEVVHATRAAHAAFSAQLAAEKSARQQALNASAHIAAEAAKSAAGDATAFSGAFTTAAAAAAAGTAGTAGTAYLAAAASAAASTTHPTEGAAPAAPIVTNAATSAATSRLSKSSKDEQPAATQAAALDAIAKEPTPTKPAAAAAGQADMQQQPVPAVTQLGSVVSSLEEVLQEVTSKSNQREAEPTPSEAAPHHSPFHLQPLNGGKRPHPFARGGGSPSPQPPAVQSADTAASGTRQGYHLSPGARRRSQGLSRMLLTYGDAIAHRDGAAEATDSSAASANVAPTSSDAAVAAAVGLHADAATKAGPAAEKAEAAKAAEAKPAEAAAKQVAEQPAKVKTVNSKAEAAAGGQKEAQVAAVLAATDAASGAVSQAAMAATEAAKVVAAAKVAVSERTAKASEKNMEMKKAIQRLVDRMQGGDIRAKSAAAEAATQAVKAAELANSAVATAKGRLAAAEADLVAADAEFEEKCAAASKSKTAALAAATAEAVPQVKVPTAASTAAAAEQVSGRDVQAVADKLRAVMAQHQQKIKERSASPGTPATPAAAEASKPAAATAEASSASKASASDKEVGEKGVVEKVAGNKRAEDKPAAESAASAAEKKITESAEGKAGAPAATTEVQAVANKLRAVIEQRKQKLADMEKAKASTSNTESAKADTLKAGAATAASLLKADASTPAKAAVPEPTVPVPKLPETKVASSSTTTDAKSSTAKEGVESASAAATDAFESVLGLLSSETSLDAAVNRLFKTVASDRVVGNDTAKKVWQPKSMLGQVAEELGVDLAVSPQDAANRLFAAAKALGDAKVPRADATAAVLSAVEGLLGASAAVKGGSAAADASSVSKAALQVANVLMEQGFARSAGRSISSEEVTSSIMQMMAAVNKAKGSTLVEMASNVLEVMQAAEGGGSRDMPADHTAVTNKPSSTPSNAQATKPTSAQAIKPTSTESVTSTSAVATESASTQAGRSSNGTPSTGSASAGSGSGNGSFNSNGTAASKGAVSVVLKKKGNVRAASSIDPASEGAEEYVPFASEYAGPPYSEVQREREKARRSKSPKAAKDKGKVESQATSSVSAAASVEPEDSAVKKKRSKSPKVVRASTYPEVLSVEDDLGVDSWSARVAARVEGEFKSALVTPVRRTRIRRTPRISNASPSPEPTGMASIGSVNDKANKAEHKVESSDEELYMTWKPKSKLTSTPMSTAAVVAATATAAASIVPQAVAGTTHSNKSTAGAGQKPRSHEPDWATMAADEDDDLALMSVGHRLADPYGDYTPTASITDLMSDGSMDDALDVDDEEHFKYF